MSICRFYHVADIECNISAQAPVVIGAINISVASPSMIKWLVVSISSLVNSVCVLV